MRSRVLPVLALVGLPFSVVNAQSMWLPASVRQEFDINLTKGFFEDGGPSFASFTAMPTFRFNASSSLMMEVELPFARASQDDLFGEDESVSGSIIGNPYIGLMLSPTGSTRARLGVRPGIAKEPDDFGDLTALALGVLVEYDRTEAFLPDVHTLRGSLEFGSIPERGIFAQGRGGASVLVATGSAGSGVDVLLDYGARVGMASPGLIVHGGVTGRAGITTDGSFAERTIHLLTLGVAGRGEGIRPVAEFRYFLDPGIHEGVKGLVNLGLSIGM